jgi:WD40 repeat protein
MDLEADKVHVFISYNRDDNAFSDQLDAALGAFGFSTTLDRHGIVGGEDWKIRLSSLIRDADTVVFVLSPSSARSEVCEWEVGEAWRLGKRIIPILCRPLGDARPPSRLADRNYIFFYSEPKFPDSGFGTGLARLVSALNSDLDWLREHTRLLERASEWDAADRAESRLLFGDSIAAAKAWAARRPKGAPEPTALHYEFIRASEEAEARRQNAERQQLQQMAAAQAERSKALAEKEEAQKGEAEQARRVVRRTLAGLAAAILLAAVATGAGLIAVKNQWEAVAQRDRALVTQSLFLADIARQPRVGGGTALLLAIEALPDPAAVPVRPYVLEAELALGAAWRSLRERIVFAGHEKAVHSAAFSPDGKRIVTVSDDKTARLWDAGTGKLIGEPLVGHEQGVYSALFSPDGKRIVTASADNTARLWDAETRKPIGEPLAGHERIVYRAVFSPDGKRIVTASGDGTARLWDAETRKPIGEPLTGHEKAVYSAMFSPDGKRIVTASADNTARLWDAETHKPIGEPIRGEDQLWDAAFSPDGKLIATASQDNTTRLWDAETHKPRGDPLKGHAKEIVSVAFSPDGKRFITASADDTVRSWDVAAGKPIGEPLTGHDAAVRRAMFSPDGKRIVTAS